MTTFALKFKFWLHICIELNNMVFLKSEAHVNASLKWVEGISEPIQAIYNIKSAIFSSFRL